MTPRDACEADVERLAQLWHDGWHEAHAAFAPPTYTAFRSLGNFMERVPKELHRIRTVGAPGACLGLQIVQPDEVYQFYVHSEARGTQVAQELLGDAERLLRERGTRRAFLHVVIENSRAIRFYAKNGWEKVRRETVQMPLSEGTIPFELLRMEKTLRG